MVLVKPCEMVTDFLFDRPHKRSLVSQELTLQPYRVKEFEVDRFDFEAHGFYAKK